MPIADHPCSAKGSATARPIPFDAPVITTDLRMTGFQFILQLYRAQFDGRVSTLMRLALWNQHVLRWFALTSRGRRRMLPRATAHSRLPERCAPSTVE